MNANRKTNQFLGKVSVFFRYGIYSVVLLGVAGCTHMPSLAPTPAALQLDIAPQVAPNPMVHFKRPIVLRVAGYTDARPTTPSNKIGDINATVFDMFDAQLLMQDISGTVTAALKNQLGASGFQTIMDGDKTAAGGVDFEIFGVIREFSMNIGGRDEVSIVVETTLRDVRSGDVVWSGAVAEKANRYAGVTGNTRHSITRYLSGALAKVTIKTRDAISASIMHAYPESFAQMAAAGDATPGVTVWVAPSGHGTTSQATHHGMTGQLAMTTLPARAKVYVADVYYGLSPLKLELEPGIYTINFKLDAFKTATEKVSVRQGETTQLEIRLTK